MHPAIWRVGKVLVVLIGVLFFCILVKTVLEETRLFLDPTYSTFWADVEAYHLKPDERRPRAELIAKYGITPVNEYMLTPGLHAAYLPSEDAAMANLVAYILSDHDRPTGREAGKKHETGWVVGGFLFSLLIAYVPIVVAARTAQRILTKLFCRSSASRQAREDYFNTVREKGTRWALAVAFVVALCTSAASAYIRLTPEMKARGMTIIDLTAALLWLGYLSGLWMLLVSFLVDVVLLALGRNPHHSLWDEVVALAVMVPILLFVYHNSWISIATAVITGLAGGLFAKRATRR